MPAFLVAFFGWLAQTKLGQLFFTYVVNKIVELVRKEIERRKKKQAIKDAVEKKFQPLKDAQSAKEVDDAIEKALDDL